MQAALSEIPWDVEAATPGTDVTIAVFAAAAMAGVSAGKKIHVNPKPTNPTPTAVISTGADIVAATAPPAVPATAAPAPAVPPAATPAFTTLI